MLENWLLQSSTDDVPSSIRLDLSVVRSAGVVRILRLLQIVPSTPGLLHGDGLLYILHLWLNGWEWLRLWDRVV